MNKQVIISEGKKFGVKKRSVEKIIQKITKISREELFLLDEIILSVDQENVIKENFKKLNFGYPLEYVLEGADFYGRHFFVDKRCLIPRNDTEVMVDKAIEAIEGMTSFDSKVLYIDVGTGSGAIPVSVVHNTDKLTTVGLGLDISTKALEVANINVNNHGLTDKIKLLHSDLLSIILEEKLYNNIEKLIITANLPYIKDEDYGNMDKEVILHEPAVALYGGKETGFEMYIKLIRQIQEINELHGLNTTVLFIEIGFDQKMIAEEFLNEEKLSYKIFCDNSGVERCVQITF